MLDEMDVTDRNQSGNMVAGVEPADEGSQLSEEVLEHEGPFGTRMGAGGNGVEPGARQDAGKGGRGRAVTCGSLSQPAQPRGTRALAVATRAVSGRPGEWDRGCPSLMPPTLPSQRADQEGGPSSS